MTPPVQFPDHETTVKAPSVQDNLSAAIQLLDAWFDDDRFTSLIRDTTPTLKQVHHLIVVAYNQISDIISDQLAKASWSQGRHSESV